jgi:hypothetical protein
MISNAQNLAVLKKVILIDIPLTKAYILLTKAQVPLTKAYVPLTKVF